MITFLVFLPQAMKGEKGIGGAVTATDGLSEELTEEAFSKRRYDTFMQLNLFLESWTLLVI